jgi:molybdopterin/thiamine biosynthesis adenylyltransferase
MRHNRTVLAVGQTAHQRIRAARVLVIGLNPVGTEVAKALLLFGLGHLSVCDPGVASARDLTANFFLTAADLGVRRAAALRRRLAPLNPDAVIAEVAPPRAPSDLSGFASVVCADPCFQSICAVNRLCRAAGVPFLLCDCFSFAGLLFADLGPEFAVENVDGNPPARLRIDAISNANPGVIRFVGREQPRFPQNSLIRFEGLESMTELNHAGPVNLHCENGVAEICDTSGFSKFDRLRPNGFAVEVKSPITLAFVPFSEALGLPLRSNLFTQKCALFREFFVNRLRDPAPAVCYEPATTSLIAGLAANECIKSITHYLMPMADQWFIYGRDELFDPVSGQTVDGIAEISRQLKAAVIGVGATGCEMAKLLALSGVQMLALVDGDHIETTNLNRQVLFTDSDVGRNKAAAAAETLRKARPDIEFCVHEHFIEHETDNLFNDRWFAQFGAVFAMVDSFGARGEIDQRCAPVRVPMFTGGIDRISADWQCIIPNVTPRYAVPQSFSSATDGMLSCTLKLFPNRPEHCIEWAAHQLHRLLHKKYNFQTFQECVNAAVDFFIGKFILKIKDFQHLHPKEEMVDGVYYWSRHRIYPVEVPFETRNPFVIQFIKAAANLFARSSGILIEEFDFTSLSPIIEWEPPDEDRRRGFAENPVRAQNPDVSQFDHDDEMQLDFIEAASNLRSGNYGLGLIDRFVAQKIAGGIESAVSTTASVCAAGLLTAYLVSAISGRSAERGKFVVSPFSVALYRQLSTPIVKFGNTDRVFSPWDFMQYDGNRKVSDAQKDIEIQANRRMACWATNKGRMLPGGLFGPKDTDVTFNQFFAGEIGAIELEVSLEIDGELEFLLPPVRVIVNA